MKLGFVVNPVAGMGGRVGLKGTDGVLEEAIDRGATPVSPHRAEEFLMALKGSCGSEVRQFEIITCRGSMGEDELEAVGHKAWRVLPIPAGKMSAGFKTTRSVHTKEAVKAFAADKVELIVFVGGDGTARDILAALKEVGSAQDQRNGSGDQTKNMISLSGPPALGVPSGVKMYSAVFALNPVDAAEIVSLYIEGKASVADLEVMDVDETAFRNDQLSVRLYGYMKCLYVPLMSQAGKELSPGTTDDVENQKAIAKTIIEGMDPNGLYILGPGTTMRTLAELLNTKKTTLGVDVYYRGKMVATDADEKTIINQVEMHGGKRNTWIVVSPIGRQGIVFGRGNQQISPAVISLVDKDHIIIAATKGKVRDLDGGCLKVDTGDRDADRILHGYVKVITDYREWRMLRVR